MSIRVNNWINGAFAEPLSGASAAWLDVDNPATGEVVGKVCVSSAADVDAAVKAAKEAFTKWSDMTVKMRAAVMFKVCKSVPCKRSLVLNILPCVVKGVCFVE